MDTVRDEFPGRFPDRSSTSVDSAGRAPARTAPAASASGAAAEAGRTSVTQRTIEQVKTMIAEGELVAGQQLPTERDFAALLGISRGSVREAIRALTILGILETRHGAGVYVTGLRPGDLLETFGVVAEISRGQTLVELLQVRRVLESAATATAAARITEAQLADVAEHLDRIGRGGSVEEIVAADRDFHQTIVHAAGNDLLTAMLDGLSSRTFRARVWRGHEDAAAVGRLWQEHERIYLALAARDPDAARAAAAAHVLEVENWLAANLTGR
ncbi:MULTISPECIES: FadR/GntR family transcriptional regulator [Actinoalloteichus]|uniref:Transcriptional regulator n=1 Tax=Actinoalloteichus fjordicus TaxID=1612552 RepID=A0AAC9LCZ5_9PSEU|nr:MULTISPECIES: FCD domain-containing protein [Actinoalloteichus]APU15678.1 transcriptional regulator [Actinoalloteichus fjordicus]APU21738.1 transcriptional regulator [Actinoalloteichus sp. GBA129-24]